ncbi:hypothetical protein OS493_000164 [Desmophyllum pertusum]|uniref:Uncharacterized protein n=1 Tax=Desmophyllum pertusum TaxID=174260 RepID=A0A9X0A748_9CNID|nr:hypothetical protein OS493_000164 [Desmophyllum pertusum]
MSSTGRGFGQSGDQNFDGGRPSKFLYAGKNKKLDPWGTSDNDHDDGIELALQPKNKLLKTKDTRSSPGCELDDVWSIRKNVQVTQASKKGTVLNTTKSTPSYYSRHGGLSGTGDANSSILNKGHDDDFLGSSSDHKSWSIPSRGNFSYSDKPKFGGTHGTSPLSQPDDFLDTRNSPSTDEFDIVHKKNLLNSKLRMAGAPQISSREMSARTRRAKKMHDAHLRSMGLAQYTPSDDVTQNNDDDFL